MICYSDSGRLVFATVVPEKKRNYYKAIDFENLNSDYFEILDDTKYYELSENMEPSQLHEKFQECFKDGNFYSFRNCQIDFKNGIGYFEDFDRVINFGKVKEFKLKRPIITEFCLKGNFNSFAYGRKVTSADDCNLFKLIGQDKNTLQEIRSIIRSEEREIAEAIIMSKYPEFAEFYYNLMPEVKIEEQSSFSIKALNQARKVDKDAEDMLKMLPIAEANGSILRLLPKKK